MDGKIITRFVVELMGSPKDHVENTMKLVMDKISKDEKFKVKDMKMYELTEVKSLWSTFIDVEIEFNELKDIMGFCFDYMPSSVEVIEPERLKDFKLNNISELMNEMLAKLHKYDLILKNLNAENIMMRKKLEEN